MAELVIGVDSSTQSTKAIAWNRNGECIAEGRFDIPLSNPSPSRFEQNPEDWWKAFCMSTKALAQKINISDVDALSISNQRETIAYLDESGKSLYPAMLWLDERARTEVDELCELVGRERMLQITGRPPDTCPALKESSRGRRRTRGVSLKIGNALFSRMTPVSAGGHGGFP